VATNDKIYPGNVDRYRELRAAREEAQAKGEQTDPALVLAEELAGIAYIADGIRYSLRKN
jgi:hypothetical protein